MATGNALSTPGVKWYPGWNVAVLLALAVVWGVWWSSSPIDQAIARLFPVASALFPNFTIAIPALFLGFVAALLHRGSPIVEFLWFLPGPAIGVLGAWLVAGAQEDSGYPGLQWFVAGIFTATAALACLVGLALRYVVTRWRTESNRTPHADARDVPAPASGSGARAGGRER